MISELVKAKEIVQSSPNAKFIASMIRLTWRRPKWTSDLFQVCTYVRNHNVNSVICSKILNHVYSRDVANSGNKVIPR